MFKGYCLKFTILSFFISLITTVLVLYSTTTNKLLKFNTISKPYQVKNYKVDGKRMENADSQQIFFIETHLHRKRSIESARLACSIESAARINPDMDVYFLLATNESEVTLEQTNFLHVLLSYPNIRIRFANIEEFTNGTKVEKFFKEKRIEKSKHQIEHTSDVLRMLVLNKYGGIYLDIDVISLIPMRMIKKKNFLCIESNNRFANGLMKFDKIEGKKYSDIYLEKILTVYNPNAWTSIGPDLVSSIILSFCKPQSFQSSQDGQCDNVTLWAQKRCFPVFYTEYSKLYKEEFINEVFEEMTHIGMIFIHFWNHIENGQNYKLNKHSKAAYTELAKVYCPKTFEVMDIFI